MTAMVHVRVEEKLKAKATKALAAMGLSVSDAVRRGGLPSFDSVAALMADSNAED